MSLLEQISNTPKLTDQILLSDQFVSQVRNEYAECVKTIDTLSDRMIAGETELTKEVRGQVFKMKILQSIADRENFIIPHAGRIIYY